MELCQFQGALVSTTPSLKSALDIGVVAVQYDAEGQFANALGGYQAALQQIIQLLSKEPRGKRKELLHKQVILFYHFLLYFNH